MIRVKELDVLRGIAILAVIAIHVSTIQLDSGSFNIFITMFFNQATRFAVPIFLFISGFALTITDKPMNFYEFIKKRLKRIVPLYLVWCFIYMTLNIITSKDAISSIIIIKDVLTGAMYYHLYYVPLIIIFYCLFFLTKPILKTKWFLIISLLVTITSQVLGNYLNVSILTNPINPLNWLFYFSFGVYAVALYKQTSLKVKISSSLLTISSLFVLLLVTVETIIMQIAGMNFSQTITAMRPSILILSILVIILAFNLSWKDTFLMKILNKLADNSYGIYLSHAAVLTVFQHGYSKVLNLPKEGIFYLGSAFITVLFTSYAVSILVDIVLGINSKSKVYLRRKKQLNLHKW